MGLFTALLCGYLIHMSLLMYGVIGLIISTLYQIITTTATLAYGHFGLILLAVVMLLSVDDPTLFSFDRPHRRDSTVSKDGCL